MVRLFRGKTPKINIDKDKDSSKSIASLEKITINGLKHWVLIRGHNLENPLLLFLHGGPGSSEMGFAHKYERNLEKHFIFVNWDQRGAGKTYSFRTPKETMNVEQFVSDGYQLILYLLERFKKKKIVLVGHSWGSALGTLLVQRYPELFYAYIGIGQVVNTEMNEQLSYEFTVREAEKTNNKKALRQLSKVHPPYGKNINQLRIQRKWMNVYGGALYGQKNTWPLLKVFFRSPEYSLRDLWKFFMGVIFSLNTMWNEYCHSINFMDNFTQWPIPVFFLAGHSDYNTPFELVERYYHKIKAPYKELVWFEKSAHLPCFEEPEKFDQIMIEKILPIIDVK